MNDNSIKSLAESRVPEGCLSDLTLDSLRCADLSESRASEAERHLENCARCRARAESLSLQSRELESELPDLNVLLGAKAAEPNQPASNVTSLAKARAARVRWWAPALGALSVAAALALFLGKPAPRDAEIRLKGVSGELDVFVKRHGKVFRWQAEPLMPGDQLRYSFRAPESLHVMVLSREASGVVNQYFPAEPSSFAVDMGVTLSKSATELDDSLGAETLWAVFCQQPFGARKFQTELETTGVIAPTEGCAIQRIEFAKVAP